MPALSIAGYALQHRREIDRDPVSPVAIEKLTASEPLQLGIGGPLNVGVEVGFDLRVVESLRLRDLLDARQARRLAARVRPDHPQRAGILEDAEVRLGAGMVSHGKISLQREIPEPMPRRAQARLVAVRPAHEVDPEAYTRAVARNSTRHRVGGGCRHLAPEDLLV